MMQSALDFLKEAVAKPHRSLSHSTVAGLTGDIMYFMLLNEIAQAQSSNASVAPPRRLETVSRTLTASGPTPAGESPAACLPRRTVADMRHTDRTVPDEWLATLPSFPPASHQSTPKLANVQIQSGQDSESTLAPDHYHWHNGNRKEDKMAQDYLESLQHQFVKAANAAKKLNNARAMMATNCAIRRWTTAMLNSHSINKKLHQTSSEPHQKTLTPQHHKAMYIVSKAYDRIQATPRGTNQHHITLMGNDISNGVMASDDPMMAPDELDLAFFNLSESIMLWNLNMHTSDTTQDHKKDDTDAVQLTARPSAVNIKTELPAFVTFTNEAVLLVTAADTLSDVSLIDESLTQPDWRRSPVSPYSLYLKYIRVCR